MIPAAMDPKPRPNHRRYVETLRAMTPGERMAKAFELSEFSKRLFVRGLRERHPRLDEEAFRALVLRRLSRCHNRNY
jgi:hypothetical protein